MHDECCNVARPVLCKHNRNFDPCFWQSVCVCVIMQYLLRLRNSVAISDMGGK